MKGSSGAEWEWIAGLGLTIAGSPSGMQCLLDSVPPPEVMQQNVGSAAATSVVLDVAQASQPTCSSTI